MKMPTVLQPNVWPAIGKSQGKPEALNNPAEAIKQPFIPTQA
tara:strand:+ start:5725 stop:5850 length:126 start_codon:yes stop_codon:yes gene_type:complete